ARKLSFAISFAFPVFSPERPAPTHEESPHRGRSSVLGRSFRKRPRQEKIAPEASNSTLSYRPGIPFPATTAVSVHRLAPQNFNKPSQRIIHPVAIFTRRFICVKPFG